MQRVRPSSRPGPAQSVEIADSGSASPVTVRAPPRRTFGVQKRRGVSLAALRQHGRNGPERLALGLERPSIDARSTRKRGGVVKLERGSTLPPAELLVSSVVVGVDGSEAGYEACRQAARLTVPGSRIELVCAVDVARVVHAGFSASTIAGELAAEGTAALDAAAEIFAGRASPELVEGGAVQALLRTVDRTSATLLVVGSHGHRRAAEIVLGGVAGELLHAAPCAVLVIARDGGARPLSARNRRRCRRLTGVGARALRCRGSRSPVRRTAAGRDGAAREGDRPGASPQPRAVRRSGRRAAGRRPGRGGRRCRSARRRKSRPPRAACARKRLGTRGPPRRMLRARRPAAGAAVTPELQPYAQEPAEVAAALATDRVAGSSGR